MSYDNRHEENQRRLREIESRLKELEGDVLDIKLLRAEQKGQWKTIKWLLGIGALLLTSNLIITLLSRMGIG